MEWALCHSRLTHAYLDLSLYIEPDHRLKSIAILHSRMALAFVTAETSIELWHALHLDLYLLHKRYALIGAAEDIRLSEEYYRVAFGLDREKHPRLYEILRTMYDLYCERFLLELEKNSAEL
jgi:hypothetical protein